MPLDTIKTRMQSIEAKSEYRNSFNCAARIVKEEGFLTLWSGALPRLGRLILSGGIVFTMCVHPLVLSVTCSLLLIVCVMQVRKNHGVARHARSGQEVFMKVSHPSIYQSAYNHTINPHDVPKAVKFRKIRCERLHASQFSRRTWP